MYEGMKPMQSIKLRYSVVIYNCVEGKYYAYTFIASHLC